MFNHKETRVLSWVLSPKCRVQKNILQHLKSYVVIRDNLNGTDQTSVKPMPHIDNCTYMGKHYVDEYNTKNGSS